MKTALVTGDRGFIGRHIKKRLLTDGWEVAGLDIKQGAHEDCRRFFATGSNSFDLVVHCAAVVGGRHTIDNEPLKVATDFAIDADLFQYVARTRPRRTVYFSSSAAYPVKYQRPENHIELTEAYFGAGDPDGVYGRVKMNGEYLASLVEPEVTILRPFSGYGSDQDTTYPFPAIIRRALGREDPITVWGSAHQTRDWIHVDDIVEAVIASIDLPPLTANLCTGQVTAMGDLALLAAEACGYSPDVTVVRDAPMGVMHRIGSPHQMLRLGLPYPAVTIEQGVARAVKELMPV